MRAVSIDRSALLQTAFVSLLNLLALGCLAAVLAYWTWRWLLPASGPAAPADVAVAVAPGQADALFGRVARDAVVAAAGIRLLGVVAAAEGYPGYAVLQVEGQRIVAARAGTELAPGLRLLEVRPRQVVLERSGVRELLVLPTPPAPTPVPVH